MTLATKAITAHDLGPVVRKLWARAITRAFEDAGQDVGKEIPLDLNSPALKPIYRDIAERIVGINQVTRDAIKGYVKQGQEQGLSPGALAKLIREDPSGAFNAGRARLIARTESATAYNRGSVAGWRKSGRVKRVTILDGSGCDFPLGHGGGNANGLVVTLDEFDAAPVGHPGCRRSAAPIVEAA